MKIESFSKMIRDIVSEASKLKDKYTKFKDAPVNYACVFCQNNEEYMEFRQLAMKLGEIIENTPSGPLFRISSIDTVSGKLQLVKIREYDATRLERGDADFTINNFDLLKRKCTIEKEFNLIRREGFEMIELIDPSFNVRAYFSNPPLDVQLGIV